MKKRITDLITTDGLVRAAKWMRRHRKPGYDGETRDQFLKRIEETDLADDILTQLATGSYNAKPLALRQIPKANGKMREIYIPTVQDAAVQAALVAGLTPMTESRFLDNSYGFRPKRNVSGAVKEASRLMSLGYTVCYSVDLETFFPNMNRDLVRKYLRDYDLDDDTRRLINSFITARVIGQKIRNHQGVPAGLPLAPTLANMYLHSLDLLLSKMGIPFIRYADDITLFFRSVEDCLFHESFWGECEQRFKIVVNREKTKMYAEGFRPVLGFHLDEYGGITVSRTVIGKIEESLSGLLAKPQLLLSEKVERIRQRMVFSLDYYKDVQNFDEFQFEIDRLQARMVDRINRQFSLAEVADSFEVPIERLDEFELFDEFKTLLEAIKPKS